MRNIALAVLAMLGSILPFSARADESACAPGPFEIDLQKISAVPPLPDDTLEQRRAADQPIPVEFSRIKEGGYSYFVGASINDGLVTWSGFDLERRIFISVLGRAGPQLTKRLPNEKNLNARQLVRSTLMGGYQS